MSKIIEIEFLENNSLHENLILRIPEIDVSVIADVYYLTSEEYNVNSNSNEKRNSLVDLLLNWKKALQRQVPNSLCFLPFDLSDEYVGCFKVEALDGVMLQCSYGRTREIMGMMIDVSDISDFKPEDFETDNKSFLVKKEDLLESIESCIKVPNSRKES